MGSSEEYGNEKSGPASPEQHDVGVGVTTDHGADSELQRRLSSRHITMIALGSSIGMGLWLGTGTSLTDGGPAALLIGCKSPLAVVFELLDGTVAWSGIWSYTGTIRKRFAYGNWTAC